MKKDTKQISFQLSGIRTEQFATFEENYSAKKETELGIGLQFKLDEQGRHIAAFLRFDFIQVKKVFLKIEISCHFQIEDKSWKTFIQDNDKKLVLPKEFLAHLAMITTGTSRGVLFAKTEGTAFSNFIIPTLNVTELISEDAVFESNEKTN